MKCVYKFEQAQARVQAELWDVFTGQAQASSSLDSSLLRYMHDKLDSTRVRGRPLNFLICNLSGVQASVCEQPIYIYIYL